MFLSLEGQTAIVTGAAEGIGRAIAARLAKAGATVAVADYNENGALAAARDLGGAAFGVGVDVSDNASVGRMVNAVLERTRRVDVLVNNAGIGGRAAPVWEQSDEDWDRVLRVNLTGVFYCCRAVVPHMRAQRYGRIVNIASIAGKEGNPNMCAYSASKAGVIAFTKSLAKEVATEGICVNSISPAVIRTRILDQLTPAQVDYMTERIPMRRTGTVEEVAAVAHFLASRDASFVTGQCYDVSGGRATY
ncbi:MAG TPA: SDR family NAD(P)-dependent oxidoreductase [Bryobacterales bacterium]|jgi:NAD(P)-dependent dehydrogenase (short-subunit alcohol dehydrogenase family)|nr:SDR family NAD(P)-dependent oxidoreductase [Bryobacterales bacterium]